VPAPERATARFSAGDCLFRRGRGPAPGAGTGPVAEFYSSSAEPPAAAIFALAEAE